MYETNSSVLISLGHVAFKLCISMPYWKIVIQNQRRNKKDFPIQDLSQYYVTYAES